MRKAVSDFRCTSQDFRKVGRERGEELLMSYNEEVARDTIEFRQDCQYELAPDAAAAGARPNLANPGSKLPQAILDLLPIVLGVLQSLERR